MTPGYRGDGGGLDPLFSGQAQARLNEQCRKAQATQAAVDARAARKAQEPCGDERKATAAPEPPGNSVTENYDAQGSLMLAEDGKQLAAILAGMLYDFAGYLTTRPEGFFVGGAYGPQPVIEALWRFAAKRGLSLAEANVQHWHEALACVRDAPACVRDAPASPLTTVAGLPDGRGKR